MNTFIWTPKNWHKMGPKLSYLKKIDISNIYRLKVLSYRLSTSIMLVYRKEMK